ncbi:MAG: hypothetical protein HY920_05105 [Elusimicrobia bacterium]|nr:hypothetical protein [Elusimicrobiota bacterium]
MENRKGKISFGLRAFSRVLFYRKYLFALVFIVILEVVLLKEYLVPARYEAVAIISWGDKEEPTGIKLEQLDLQKMTSNARNHIALMKSRPIYKEVIKKLAQSNVDYGVFWDQFLNKSEEDRLKILNKIISLVPVPLTQIIEIKVRTPEPKLCADIANTLALLYREWDLSFRKKEALWMMDYLQQDLDKVHKEINDTETQLAKYRAAQTLDLNPDPSQAAPSAIARLEKQRVDNQERANTYSAQLRQFEKKLNIKDEIAKFTQPDEVGKVLQSLKDLEIKRAYYLQNYNDEHPNVRSVDKNIKNMRSQINTKLTLYLQNKEDSFAKLPQVTAALGNLIAANMRRDSVEQVITDLLKRKWSEKDKYLPEDDLRVKQLQRDIGIKESYYTLLTGQKDKLGIYLEMNTSDRIHLISPADLPEKPVTLPLINIIAGSVFGLFVAFWAVFLLEYRDYTFKTTGELSRIMGVPLFGNIPVFITSAKKKKTRTNILADRNFQRINCQMEHNFYDPGPKIIQVISSIPGEGKTTCAAGIAKAAAVVNYRTLIIDTNFINPSLHKVFGLPSWPGLLDLLDGKELADVVYPSSQANLEVIPIGNNPLGADLKSPLPYFERLLDLIKGQFDRIIIDGTPLLLHSWPLELAPRIDQTFLIVLSRATRRNDVLLSLDIAKSANLTMQLILNGIQEPLPGWLKKTLGKMHLD